MSEAKRFWIVGPRTTAAVVVGVAFIVGGLAGASVLREFGRGERAGGPRSLPGMKLAHAPVEEAEEGREPGKASERTIAQFAKALALTAAQTAAVDSVSAHEFAAVSAIRDETWPRMQAVLDETRLRIDSILTPDQRARYHEMLARIEERSKREQAAQDSGPKPASKP